MRWCQGLCSWDDNGGGSGMLMGKSVYSVLPDDHGMWAAWWRGCGVLWRRVLAGCENLSYILEGFKDRTNKKRTKRDCQYKLEKKIHHAWSRKKKITKIHEHTDSCKNKTQYKT